MHDILREIIKMTNCVDAVGLRVNGTETETVMSAVAKDATMVVYVIPKQPLPTLAGDYGIPHVKLLDGLLAHESYRRDFQIERFTHKNIVTGQTQEAPLKAIFGTKKRNNATFYFSQGASIKGSNLTNLIFDVEVTPTREVLREFAKLASLFATPECEQFTVSIEDGVMTFALGNVSSTTNHGEMIFTEDARGRLAEPLVFSSSNFNSVVKTIGDRELTVSFSNRKVLKIATETDHCRYEYWQTAMVKK